MNAVDICMRADASRSIGSGHVMRCLTLADRLRTGMGARITFLCRELEGNLITYIRARGYDVGVFPGETKAAAAANFTWAAAIAASAGSAGKAAFTASAGSAGKAAIAAVAGLPGVEEVATDATQAVEASWMIEWLANQGEGRQPDWLIIDHYGLDRRYEQRIRPHFKKVMVIDDLADRAHDCDVLLDANLGPERAERHRRLVDPGTRLLLGPQYALLRPEFAALRSRVRRDGRIRRLLVSFGGVDPTGETGKTLDALAQLADTGLTATVLAGQSNPQARLLAERCAGMRHVQFAAHSDRMAALMLEADVAIGAGGTSTWERCCLGLPSLVVTVADNQEALTAAAAREGAVCWLGAAPEVGADRIREAVLALYRDPAYLRRMSARAMRLVDGWGAERIARELVR